MEKKAFTLIELLVVVSIISLLASVVLASLNTAREKARIGAARQFSAIVNHAVGDQSLALFNFAEGSGASTRDVSGSNTMTLSSAGLWTSAALSGATYALSFNGTSDYAYSQAMTLNGTNETVGLWIKTSGATGIMAAGQDWWRRLFTDEWLFVDSGNHYVGITFPAPINDGKWHYTGYSLSGTTVKVFLDGAIVGQATLPAAMAPYTGNWQIGGQLCSGTCGNYIAASYAGLQVYNGSIF